MTSLVAPGRSGPLSIAATVRRRACGSSGGTSCGQPVHGGDPGGFPAKVSPPRGILGAAPLPLGSNAAGSWSFVMLHIHRAERADALVAALGAIVAEPLDDVMAAEVVAVPTRGVERWLSQRLSARLGAGPG